MGTLRSGSTQAVAARLLALVFAVVVVAAANGAGARVGDLQPGQIAQLDDLVAGQQKQAELLAQTIGAFAELGYQETRSSKALTDYLKDGGFKVRSGVAGIPTAFVASAGRGKPVIGILAEFDALPGLSQAPVPERSAIAGAAAGHACGHHLFGAASATAGRALAQWLDDSGQSGTIKVFGTPAEEGGSGKVYMAREGIFADVDIMLHWHPGDSNEASAYATTANKSGRFTFHGTPSHAASAPERGRSALDAVEAMNYMVNLMREHVPSEARIHYVITDGGAAPNVVPERAQVYYYVRHPERDRTAALFERVTNVAKAAAGGTETRVDIEVMHGNYPVLPNETLSEVVHQYLSGLGGLRYTAKERAFANTLRDTFSDELPPLASAGRIAPLRTRQAWGSTDVGDVSWQVPTVGFSTATWVPGTSAHTWQAVAAGGMSIGNKGMMLAANTLALIGARLFQDPELMRRAYAEFNERRGADFQYSALLGDRQPPLDYRK